LLLAEDRYKQALVLDPTSGTMQAYSLLLGEVGRLKEANAMKRQLLTLEPFVIGYNTTAALWLWAEGQTDTAITMLKDQPPNAAGPILAPIYASLGLYAEAADLLETASAGNPAVSGSSSAARLLRTVPSKTAAPEKLPSISGLGWVYLYVGTPERALEPFERDVQNGFAGSFSLPVIWHASYAAVRKTERFKTYVRARGLLDYWRARGWPQWCHPTTGDDFACE
jgi:tetratricopeptide (TPR) repeat protein